MAEEWC